MTQTVRFISNFCKAVIKEWPERWEISWKIKRRSESQSEQSKWLTKFKSRHGIRRIDISGKDLLADKAAAEVLKVNFNKFLLIYRGWVRIGEYLKWKALLQKNQYLVEKWVKIVFCVFYRKMMTRAGQSLYIDRKSVV